MENSLLFHFLTSSLGKKTLMALTGLFLCLFLCEHLYTNLLLYAGDGGVRFNEASESMVRNLLIRTVEIVLFLAIIGHTVQALRLTRNNSAARSHKYAVNVTNTSSWFSRNMLPTGAIILVFIIVHLSNFFVPYRIEGSVGHGADRLTLAQTVASALSNPWYAGLYLLGVLFLALHLNHGFQSAFHTLGLNNRRYANLLKAAGTGFALLIGFGFGSFPVTFYLSSELGYDLLNWNREAAANTVTVLSTP
jgi:succinate dehydrogenase / fumarate reductase, cytochrome b subunit